MISLKGPVCLIGISQMRVKYNVRIRNVIYKIS